MFTDAPQSPNDHITLQRDRALDLFLEIRGVAQVCEYRPSEIIRKFSDSSSLAQVLFQQPQMDAEPGSRSRGGVQQRARRTRNVQIWSQSSC